jgi:hypothetical protein
MKLQKRHGDLLYSHKELMDSYSLLESTHEVTVTMVKDSQPHTCTCAQPSIDLSYANSCCSQAKPSCDEHVLIETCDSLIASKNDELKRENKMLKMELSRLKCKGHVQLSQDNHDHMVKKLEKGSTVTCAKLPQINLKISYQKFDKPKINKKAHVKCFECSILGHFSSKCPNKKSDQAKPSRRQRSLSQRRCFGYKEKDHNIAVCPKEEGSKSVKTGLSGLANRSIQFRQKILELQGSTTKASRCHLISTWARMKVSRGNPKTKQVESSIKLATLIVTNITLVRIVLKLKLSFIRLSKLIYLMWNPRMTLVLPRWLVHLVIVLMPFGYQNTYWLTMKDPIRLGYQNLLDQVIGGLRCIGSLIIKEKMI